MYTEADFDALTPSERRFIEPIAAKNKDKPWHQLASFGGGEAPAVEGGRLVRVRIYDTGPKELDLRGLDALVSFSTVWKVGLKSLTLGDHPRLAALRLEDNALKALDVGGCTALRHLDVRNNQLSSLKALPKGLVDLLCAQNPLEELDVSSLTSLEQLSAFECGLTKIDLEPLVRLREVLLHSNQLRQIDCSSLTAVTSMFLNDNGARITLPKNAPALANLGADGNPIENLDASGYPALLYLRLARCGLRSLQLDNPALELLDVENNALETLDLTMAPRLSHLKLAGNPLKRIDLSPLRRLSSVTWPDQAELVVTELQKNTVPELRARFGLPKGSASLPKMGPYELHRVVDEYNWDDGAKKLTDVVRHPSCDKATALLVYWLSEPAEYTQYAKPADAPKGERKMLELLREIEKKMASGGFGTELIPFDVSDVGGTDLSDDDAGIPAIMREPVKPKSGATLVAPPVNAAVKAAPKKKTPKKKH